MHYLAIPLLVIGIAAAAFDLRTRRIPNFLTFGAAAAGLAFHLFSGGLAGGGWSLAGWLVGCALFMPLFALRGLGAGDVKLLAAFGAWVGPLTAFWAAIFTVIAGGLLAVIVALAHGYLRRAITNLKALVSYWHVAGVRPFNELTLETAKGPRLAYSVPIVVGSLVAVWLK